MPNPEFKPDFSQIIKNNPSGYILRTKLSEATGGLLHGRTEANNDSLGIGIHGRIMIGKRKVAYPVESVVEYLQAKVILSYEIPSVHNQASNRNRKECGHETQI